MFKSHIYLKIAKNAMTLRHVESRQETARISASDFTTERLLVGHFSKADALIKQMLKELRPYRVRLLAPAPCMLVHPLEMVEGGLSEVEERVLMELGYSAGARKVKIYVGPELHDSAVVAYLQ